MATAQPMIILTQLDDVRVDEEIRLPSSDTMTVRCSLLPHVHYPAAGRWVFPPLVIPS
jgi:hypothetical protein